MYKLVVADDVEAARVLLAECIKRSNPSVEIAGIFADGSEVIEYLRNNKVDVIITDIKMIEMSGLDIAKYVFDNSLKTNVIIVSAYDDFEYAKRAIKFGVFEYLSKPIDMLEVNDAIKRVIAALKRDAAEEKSLADMSKDKRMCFWERIVLEKETVDTEAFERLYPNINLEEIRISSCILDTKNYQTFKNTKWNYESEKLDDAIYGMVRVTLNDMKVDDVDFVNYGSGRFLMIIIKKENTNVDLTKVISNIVSLLKLDVECMNASENCRLSEINTKICFDGGGENAKKIFSDSADSVRKCIEKAKEYISNNIENNIYREEISSYVGYSNSYFAKCFKENVGTSLNKYIQNERIKRIILLLNTDMKIIDIADRMNYSSVKHMGRSFKTNVGMTPAEYRKKVIRKPLGGDTFGENF